MEKTTEKMKVEKRKSALKYTLVSIAFILTAVLFFVGGLFWHTMYYGIFQNVPNNRFFCHSYSNFFQDYQTNCTIPPLSKNPFYFKNHLACEAITNQQLAEQTNRWGKVIPGKEIMLIKSDYVHFSLDFKDKILSRSTGVGQSKTEPYTIILDSHDIIQAVRPVKPENFDSADSYEFITFSKATGKGMEIWHNVANFQNLPNPDSIGSHFFQCQ